jgi:hypothetical protein
MSVITATEVQSSVNCWDEIVSDWLLLAERDVKSVVVVKKPVLVAPRVALVPLDGPKVFTGGPIASSRIPVMWVPSLPTDRALDPNVIQFLALSTYATFHIDKPLIGKGAELANEAELLFHLIACVGALRAGVIAAAGVLPLGNVTAALKMTTYKKENIWLRRASKRPPDNTWSEKVWETIRTVHGKFQTQILAQIAHLGPVVALAGMAIAVPSAMSPMGRMLMTSSMGAIAQIFGNSAMLKKPWVTDFLAVEVACAFPQDMLTAFLTDAAIGEAISRCFSLSDEAFVASQAREAMIRERYRAGGTSYIGSLAVLMGKLSTEHGDVEGETDVFSDDEDVGPIEASAITPDATLNVVAVPAVAAYEPEDDY